MLLHEFCVETRDEMIDQLVEAQTSLENDYVNNLYTMDDHDLLMTYFKYFLDQSIILEDTYVNAET